MKRKNIAWLVLVLLLSAFSFSRLLRPGYFPMHDDMQPIRLLQMDKCFADGQFPCRWVPDLGFGYGYPLYIYYSPLAYYSMEIFRFLGFSILGAIKIEFILTFVFSGLTMFLFGKSLWGKWGGVLSAIFYVYAPFRASDVYARGAVGEFTALVFLPLVFWAIHEYVSKEKLKYLIYLSLSFAALAITHNITLLIFTPVAVFWGLFLLWQKKKWALLPKIALGGLLGVGIASFYLLPVIFEKRLAHVETMTMGYFNYLAHFASLRQLFLSTHWGYGSSELGANDDLNLSIGIFHWLFALLTLVIAFFQRRSKEKKQLLPILCFFGLVGLGGAFMSHQRSVFLYNRIPALSYLQFPWRFLTIIIFSFSVLVGGITKYFKKYLKVVVFLSLFVVIFFNAPYFTPRIWFKINDQEKLSGASLQNQVTASIYDYLPIYAKAPPATAAPDYPEAVGGEIEVLSFEKGTDWEKGEIRVISDGAQVKLPLFYFPKFEVLVDGELVAIDHQNDLGLITFWVDEGVHDFEVELKNTPVRTVGDLISLSSIIFIIGWSLYEKKNKTA